VTANRLDAVRTLLDQLGIAPEELLGDTLAARSGRMPTIEEYVTRVTGAVSPGTHRVYGTYWRKVSEAWGHRPLDELTPTEIRAFAEQVKTAAVIRRNSRGGRAAAEHLISALRCLYRHAEADGLISAERNPATAVAKPRRLASTRRALPNTGLIEINYVAASTGNDPDLDVLLLRLHTETACRRGGALALRPTDLDVEQCLIRLREKGETVRWQPVSPTLMRRQAGRALAAVPVRTTDHRPPLRPPLAAAGPAPGLGTDPADLDPLAATHDPHLGGTQLRLRRRPGLRRAQRLPRRSRHLHLCPRGHH
jgi:hypothetical protein